MAARRPLARLLAGTALLAPLAVACSNDGDNALPELPTTTVTTPDAPIETVDLVDRSRPTTSPDGEELAPDRALPTVVHLPPGDGPAPLIVFGHGLGGSPAGFDDLLDAWAAAGFVVAVPRFPVSNGDTGGPYGWDATEDVVNQPGDVGAVIDGLVARSDEPDGPLAGRIDPARIGVAGLSLGGGTVYGVLGTEVAERWGVDAAVVFAGAIFEAQEGTLDLGASEVPVLAFHGNGDPVVDHADGERARGELGGPSWFVTLDRADHVSAFMDVASPWDQIVVDMTTAFWMGTLGGDAPQLDTLVALGEDNGVVEVDVDVDER
jgi:dienelactone hydrolase